MANLYVLILFLLRKCMNKALLFFSLTLPFSAAWAANETFRDDMESQTSILETLRTADIDEIDDIDETDGPDNHLEAGHSHTYIRCWYRLDQTHNNPATEHRWAKQKDSDEYYSIQGAWRHKLSGKNMFYTETSQDEIMQRCVDTLGVSSNEVADITFFAANEKLSFNQTIWTQDKADQGNKINKIIAFGDSLSDTGNLFNGSEWRFPNPNSWFLGHFSNGFVWPEYLAKSQNIPLYNWSVGGAAGIDEYKVIPGLGHQIQSYFHYLKKAENYQPANTLFTLEIGLNDFMNYNREVKDVSQNLSDGLKRLVDEGGAQHIILFTLPDATRAPQFKYSTQENIVKIKSKIEEFNGFIKQQALFYQAKGIDLVLFDAHSIFDEIIKNPKEYGFVNVTDACLDINRDSSKDYLLSHSLTKDCAYYGSDKYLFWGITHPTTAVHKVFADKIIETGFFNRH